MSATVGNQWWKLRAKHGRDKIFTDKQILLECAYDYLEKTEQRKWIKKDWVGKDAIEVNRELDTPFSLAGLCIFLGISKQTWINYRKEYEVNNKDFFDVITHIEEIIFTQKYEGALNGTFKENIIAREYSLGEKIDLTTNGETINQPKTLELVITKMNNTSKQE